MNKTQKQFENLKTEVSSLKIRVRRIEEYLLGVPNVDDYIREREEPEDELFEEAKKLIAKYNTVSAGFLQRRLGTGYARAARLLDLLERADMVSEGEGGKPRQVLIKKSK